MRMIEDALDWLLMLVALVLGLAFTVTCINLTMDTSSVSLYDKTAKVVYREFIPKPVSYTNADVLLMLTISDVYQPFPATLNINDEAQIEFNSSWFANKESNINTLYQKFLKQHTGHGIGTPILEYDGGTVQWTINYQ